MAKQKFAVILAGTEFNTDFGSQQHEVFTSLKVLNEYNVDYDVFLLMANTKNINNNFYNTIQITNESAKNRIFDITELNIHSNNYSALLIPGGIGVAKQFSNFVEIENKTSTNLEVIKVVQDIIQSFYLAKKPIGSICIAPIIVARSLTEIIKEQDNIELTLGEEIFSNFGINSNKVREHKFNTADLFFYDKSHNLYSTPAYMIYSPIKGKDLKVEKGISDMIKAILKK